MIATVDFPHLGHVTGEDSRVHRLGERVDVELVENVFVSSLTSGWRNKIRFKTRGRDFGAVFVG